MMSEDIKNRVIEAIQTVYDPEIPINIWEVGLVYEVRVDDAGNAHVLMTLTSPMCPVAESLPGEVEDKVSAVEGVKSVSVEITWDPPWHPDMMSEAAKLELGMD
jgi:FeS assembly SUF system protein